MVNSHFLHELFPEGVYIVDEKKHLRPPFIIAEAMEEKSVVAVAEIPAEKVNVVAEPAPFLPKYEGGLARKILVVFGQTLSATDREVLFKTIGALQPPVGVQDIALLSLAENSAADWLQLKTLLKPQFALLLGAEAHAFAGVNHAHDYRFFLQENVELIKAAMPSEWSGNATETKKLFWNEMKQRLNLA